MTRRTATWTLATATLASILVGPAARADDAPKTEPRSVLDFQVMDIDGKPVDLADYKGDVLLIVNTASKCGNTPQYAGLQDLFEKYREQGFRVLAFPANEFGKQEPGTNEEIKTFCMTKYDVTFPIFSKVVVKGDGIHPLYQYLTADSTNPDFAGPIGWNFAKFLVGRDGKVIARFAPKEEPESPRSSRRSSRPWPPRGAEPDGVRISPVDAG